MKITVDDNEINQAIKEYVVTQGIDISNSDVLVEFVAGRKKGNSANVTIVPKGTLKVDAVEETAPATDPKDDENTEADTNKLNLFGEDAVTE